MEIIQPDGWPRPKGYANGIATEGGRHVFVAGQVAWDTSECIVGEDDFPAQFRQALSNVVAVVKKAGGEASDLVSLTIFVTDKERYLASTAELGPIWNELVGRHYPAMALVQVAGLVEPGAMLEIQGIAVVSSSS